MFYQTYTFVIYYIFDIQIRKFFDVDWIQFLGIWYGVQSENEIPSCEIYNVARSHEPFKYIVSTETKLSTTNRKYKASFKEYLNVIDYDLPSKMSTMPLPRKIYSWKYVFSFHFCISDSRFSWMNWMFFYCLLINDSIFKQGYPTCYQFDRATLLNRISLSSEPITNLMLWFIARMAIFTIHLEKVKILNNVRIMRNYGRVNQI